MREFGPAPQYFGIFQSGTASRFGFPVTQQNVFVARLGIAIEKVTAEPAGRERRNQGPHSKQRPFFVPRQWLEDGDRKYFLRHEDYCLLHVKPVYFDAKQHLWL